MATHSSYLENPRQRSLVGYSHRVTKSDTTESLNIHTHKHTFSQDCEILQATPGSINPSPPASTLAATRDFSQAWVPKQRTPLTPRQLRDPFPQRPFL